MASTSKDWSPTPLEDTLEVLERFTCDSARYIDDQNALDLDTSRMMGVAIPFAVRGAFPASGFESYHVTDDPEKAQGAIAKRGNLMKTMQFWFGRLCPGLYVSTSTDYWKRSVSARRYAFLYTLSVENRHKLSRVLLQELSRRASTGYISRSEYDVGVRDVTYWAAGTNTYSISTVIGQPYNIDAPNVAKSIGIIDRIDDPVAVKVVFSGRYLMLEDRDAIDAARKLAQLSRNERSPIQEEICLALAFHGWDGVFTKSGFSSEPELVILNSGKISAFGEPPEQA